MSTPHPITRCTHARPPRTARSRRASVYVLVLGTAAIATAAGLGGLYIQRTHLRAARTASDIDRARVLAASGLEYAMARIEADANWRTIFSDGYVLFNAPLGPGTLTVTVADPLDGNILDSPSDPIKIVSTATVGSAIQGLSARIEMPSVPASVLACAAYGRNHVQFQNATTAADAPIASGATMTALLAIVNANVEGVGLVTGVTFNGTKLSGAPPRTTPPASVVDTWAALGSTINYGAIPMKKVKDVVIFPGGSIHGSPTNAQGIYVIDCAGGDLALCDVRIYGTLVVINAGIVTIDKSVRIDPTVAGRPSLLIEGNACFKLDTQALGETNATGSLNPAGAPWQGVTDTDQTDTYPCGLSGIVLATGWIISDAPLTMTGTLIALDSLTLNATTTITHDPALLASPPAGFVATTPTLSTTGVARVVN